MILALVYDDDDNAMLEFDEEGIDWLVIGLEQLRQANPGDYFTTPTVWTKDPPWWRFWNRKRDPVIGEFGLRRADPPMFPEPRMDFKG